MFPRATPLPAALTGLALAAVLTGCAGTAADAGSAAAPTTSSSAPDGSTPPAPTTAAGRLIEVTVSGDRVSGDTGRMAVPLGEHVTLVVTSDVADEVHVHGYDLTAPLAPGQPAALPVAATIPGVFEVELHDAGTVLLSLQVG